MVEKSEVERFMEFLDGVSEEVASWPAWKRGLLDAASKSTCDKPRPVIDNTHKRGETVATQLLVFQCVVGLTNSGHNEQLLKRMRIPDNVTTREEVCNWLTDTHGVSCRFMVISATQWDVAQIQSKSIKTTEWVGKAWATDDGNGPL